jgi:hypothetical protein
MKASLTVETLTFLQSFKELTEAQDWQKRIKKPTVIVHFYEHKDVVSELFAVMSEADAKCITEAIEAKRRELENT